MPFLAVPKRNARARSGIIALGLENIYEDTGDDCPGLYFRISSEADYIGETNDEEGKYFNLEDYEY